MSTPMRRQYLQIKKQYPDAIVFFRLGDFYETFDDDARTVSQVCDIVLTSRPVTRNQRVPLAGVPYHAVDSYIAKLINAGHKVAIVEQVGPDFSEHKRSAMSGPARAPEQEEKSRGLVQREVVRVVTLGTVVEPGLLPERRNNYLVALVLDRQRAGISYVDATTGEFAATQITGEEVERRVVAELHRLEPAEVLIPGDDTSRGDAALPLNALASFSCTPFAPWHFDPDTARQALLDHFEVATPDGFGLAGMPLAISAAGAILQYLAETQRAALPHLQSLTAYSTEAFMTLDPATRRNLELTSSIREGTAKRTLLGVLDATVTNMGGRTLRRWLHQPLLDLAAINRRLDAVEALFHNTPVRSELRALLKGVADLERLAMRVSQGVASPRDLVGIRRSLAVVPEIRRILREMKEEVAEEKKEATEPLQELAARLDPCESVATLIAQAIVDDPPAALSAGGVVRRGFSAELDNVLVAAHDARNWVANLEKTERARTGIKPLKVGYNKVFGYYIEVSKSNLDAVPPEYIRKQTLVNAERFITPELKEYESLILNSEERTLEIETRIFREVCQQVAAAGERMLATARALAALDVYAALAEVALRHRYVRPALTDEPIIHIVAGRHPVVEVTQREEPFVPNDVHLSPDELILVITGPNMSGKSTFLRQTALIVLMAQIGSFVPADEACIGVVDRIFTRIGAQDEIAAGQSTFMVEMVETASLLSQATRRSLLILDEIGRGTSTYDGLAIARAVVEYIHNHPKLEAKTLFATHYHELTALEKVLPRVRNYNVAVVEEGDKVVFLHKIVPGGADKSYGIHVAQLAGVPRPVIARAQEILQELEERPKAPTLPRKAVQLTLFPPSNEVVEELAALDVLSMSPLEALNKLFELQKKAREELGK
jgi:DNA mismatch repair protein MutS